MKTSPSEPRSTSHLPFITRLWSRLAPSYHLVFPQETGFQGLLVGIGCLETGQLNSFLYIFSFSTVRFHYVKMMGDVFLIYLVIINSLPRFEAKMYCDRNRNSIKLFISYCEMGSRHLNETLCKKCRKRRSAYQTPLIKANWFIK